ncbi:MAG: cysteine desulfurase-like protein [Nocardioidaceae bacterium]|nr:cysteine desulfurase-like protein [Nocardioidaceae bacterium]
MDLDIDRVRETFPALDQGVAYFDGPGGSQVPKQVADAVATTLTSGIANRGSVTAAERRADAVVLGARAAVADLLGADPGGVVFGRSMTQLTYDVSRAVAKEWGTGDEVVVTRLDHDANIRPWVQAAEHAGALVRWADFDRDTAELPVDAVTALLSQRTRLVAVTGASNLLGTRPDLQPIVAAAHDIGALVYVDGVHLTPHAPVDVATMGADFYACSPYKFFGPHLGVLVAEPHLLERLHPDKLLPATDAVPERFETGTLPYELLAGVTAAVDFIAGLASPADGSRRDRVVASMAAVEEYEDRLMGRLASGLKAIEGVTLHGRPDRRTPTLLFSVQGASPGEVHESLATRGVNAPSGSFYALEAARWLGLGAAGAVRAGMAPYTNDDDIDRLLEGVAMVTTR